METTINTLESYVTDYSDMTYESRQLAERDTDYYNHIQLTAEEIATLEKRKQPTSIYNRIRPKVSTLLGMEQQTRTDPKAYPRTPKHDKDAEIATEGIRYVIDNNNFDVIASDVFLMLSVPGTGCVDVYGKAKKDTIEIKLKAVPWDRFIYDPHSRCPHFSDARYLGVARWMDLDEALEEYPDQSDNLSSSLFNSASETLDDKPNYWTDSKRKRVRVIQLYFLQGSKWNVCEFTKGAILTEIAESPYLDEDDLPSCPLIAASANVDRQGNRFGEVRSYIGQQDEINKRRNKALHLLSQRQTYSSKGSVSPENVARLKAEMAKPDGHLEFEFGEFGKDFGVIPTNDMAQGNLALLQDAKQEIDSQGANAALSGKQEGSMSGRALQARQQGGQLEVTPLLDRHKQWKKMVYRAVWDRIKQFWTDERWIRVTDSDQKVSFVGMNVPITRGQVLQQQGYPIPDGFENDPRLGQQVGTENAVAEMDVDIIIDSSMDVVTLQQESFQILAELYKANPQAVPFDFLVEASSLPNKDRLLKKMRGEDEQSQGQQQQMQAQQQQQQQIQQQAIQLEFAEKQADVDKTQAETQKTVADAQKSEAGALDTHESAMLKHQERMANRFMIHGQQ